MAGLLLKTSICATLALCTDGALPSTGECGKICDSIKAEISSSEACAKSRKSLPRPKIGRVCQEAFDEALTLTCGELCSLHGTSRAIPSHLGEACDKRKREVPRPVAHKACVDGFNAGLASTTALVTQRIESMEEATRKSLVESNVSMLKEADAERDTLAEVGRGRQAEQEEQRKEDQERARKAIEDKSAQVKREKEALSKKQELETAQAAAQAKREKSKAEEDRQARIKAAVDAKEATKHAKLDNSSGADDLAAASRASHESPSLKTSGELGGDPRDGDSVEEDGATGAGGAPSEEGHTSEHTGALDAVGVAELFEVVPVPVGEEKSGNEDAADASRSVEIPEDGHHQEVPAADHAQGSRLPTPEDDKTQEVRAGDEAPASTAEIGPHARPEDNLAIDPPNDARNSEALTTERAEGLEAPRAPPNDSQRPDMLDGVLKAEDDQDAGTKNDLTIKLPDEQPPDVLDGVVRTENDPDAGTKNGRTIELPNDPRYREVLMAKHVEGFEASSGRADGGSPRHGLDDPVAAAERGQDPDPEDSSLVEPQRTVSVG